MAKKIKMNYNKRRNGPNYNPPRDALDELLSLTRKQKEAQKRDSTVTVKCQMLRNVKRKMFMTTVVTVLDKVHVLLRGQVFLI